MPRFVAGGGADLGHAGLRLGKREARASAIRSRMLRGSRAVVLSPTRVSKPSGSAWMASSTWACAAARRNAASLAEGAARRRFCAMVP
jgi:hypothetical protein